MSRRRASLLSLSLFAAALACGSSGGDSEDTTADPTADATGDSGGVTTGDAAQCVPAGAEGGALLWSFTDDARSGPIPGVASGLAGEMIVSGSQSGAGGTDVLVDVLVDGDSQILDVYQGSRGLADEPLGVAVDAEGFIHVLVSEATLFAQGELGGLTTYSMVVLRYAPDGTRVWRYERPYPPGPPGQEDPPRGWIGVVEDGPVVVERLKDESLRLLRLDRFGNVEVDVALAEPTLGVATALGFGPDETLSVTRLDADLKVWVGRFDLEDGDLLWSDRLEDLTARPVATIPGLDGELYFAWSTGQPLAKDFSLRRYDADGTVAWTKPMPLPPRDTVELHSALRCDGSLVLAGGVYDDPPPENEWNTRRDLWAAGFGRDGALLWSYEHDFGPPYSYGQASAVAITPDGDVLIGGSFIIAGNIHMAENYRPWLARIDGG